MKEKRKYYHTKELGFGGGDKEQYDLMEKLLKIIHYLEDTVEELKQNKMKEKTAVEQFIEQLEQQGDSWENASIESINISIKVEDYLKLKEQAKKMEKQDKHSEYMRGWKDGYSKQELKPQ